MVRDDSSHSLLRPGATPAVPEGTELAASVRLTRRPNSEITVTFKSRAWLKVGVPPTALRFTRANWNQPQSVSFAALQDGIRDGDQLVPVRMTAAVAAQPHLQATRRLVFKSLDSRVVTPTQPITDTSRGAIVGGRNSGSVQGTYDSVLNRGTVTLNVTVPQLDKVRNRAITVGYSIGPDSRVQIESLQGITASRFRWNVTYRQVGTDRGLFGTFTVRQPILGSSATATLTAAAVPSWVGTKQLGVANKETVGPAVVTDTNDNVYVAGYTTGGLYGNTMQPDSTHEFFITKYDSSGVKQFTRQLGAVGAATVGTAVTVDAIGDVFVAGSTSGGLDGNAQTGIYDFFVSKIDPERVKQ